LVCLLDDFRLLCYDEENLCFIWVALMKKQQLLVLATVLVLLISGCNLFSKEQAGTDPPSIGDANEPVSSSVSPDLSKSIHKEQVADSSAPDQNNQFKKNVELTYIALYLRQFDLFAAPVSFGYCFHDMDQNGLPELIIKTGSCEADYLYSFYMVSDGEFVECGSLSGSHAALYTNGSAGIVRYAGQMGVYDITISELKGTTLVTQEIANGTLDFGEEYPDLIEYGYGDYDQCIEFNYVSTGFLVAKG